MKKVSKKSVNYRKGSIQNHCGNCDMFHGRLAGTCDLVKGAIQAFMDCDKWVKNGLEK